MAMKRRYLTIGKPSAALHQSVIVHPATVLFAGRVRLRRAAPHPPDTPAVRALGLQTWEPQVPHVLGVFSFQVCRRRRNPKGLCVPVDLACHNITSTIDRLSPTENLSDLVWASPQGGAVQQPNLGLGRLSLSGLFSFWLASYTPKKIAKLQHGRDGTSPNTTFRALR